MSDADDDADDEPPAELSSDDRFDQLDWSEPTFLQRTVWRVNATIRRDLYRLRWLLLGKHSEAHNQRPVAKLRNLILLNAVAKGAASVEVQVEDGTRSCVHYFIDGARVMEMTPPLKIHEALVEAFAEWCTSKDDSLFGGTLRGAQWLKVKDRVVCHMMLTVRRPAEAHGAVFVDVERPSHEPD